MAQFLWQFIQSFVQSVVMPMAVLAFVHLLCAIHGKDRLERSLPTQVELARRPSLETRILDRNGYLLTTLRDEQARPELVPLSDIPLLTRLAFVSIEDERFYSHDGVDPRGILRAAWKNARAGHLIEGGSTITQQLVKNRFLTSERSLDRKLKEFLLALKMERLFSKDEILCQYLNEIYFGMGIYGVGAAARTYLGKRVSELTLAESAVLAGMVKAPNRFNPFAPGTAWRDRQRLVLAKMLEQGYISPEQARQATAEQVAFARGALRREGSDKAPYFLAQIKKNLVDAYGFKTAFGGGLRVTTSLDWRVQQAAERAFANAAVFRGRSGSRDPTLQGAFLALDPVNGDILAMVGGRDFAVSQFNRAIQARRQPGSSFKPFVYCSALFGGLDPNTIIDDEPVSYADTTHEQFWEPRNFGDQYHGPTTLAEALARSYNAVAVKLLDRVGILDTVAVARRLGIVSPLHDGLALALGASEVTLMEMVNAYSVFANRGMRAVPRPILKVEDYDGKLLQVCGVDQRDAIDEVTAFTMTQMLRGVVERGTGRAALVPGHVVAGKTGTTNGLVDAWFIGFTPRIVAGCYVGHDDRKGLGGNATGGHVAAPIVGAFLKEFLAGRAPDPFPQPVSVKMLSVCGQSGMLPCDGCEETWEMAFEKSRAPSEICTTHGDGGYTSLADEPSGELTQRPWLELPGGAEEMDGSRQASRGPYGTPQEPGDTEEPAGGGQMEADYERSLAPWVAHDPGAGGRVRTRIRSLMGRRDEEDADPPAAQPPP
ncbi:MAG: PBP1A family penicillin-binding protein [Candidatus Wallbacteria bacterium]|nr:PBP1A family penicillin-binding protein [Candidatus Wallbacteria bacterium]